jgi:ectoine hydroxylase-related dioxygenase (phytanoyl-CoA dioxygenase family)
MNLNKKNIDFFTQHGWLKITSMFKKKEIDIIEKKIDFFLKNKASQYKGRDINFADNSKNVKNINSFHKLHDVNWIKKLGNTKKITNFTKQLIKSKKIELRASEYFAKPKKIGLPVPIHQDNFYWNIIGGKALTIWIALSQSSKKNGALFYFDRSHKEGVCDHVASFAKGSSQKIKDNRILKKYKKITPTLKKGDALFHHCEIAHGSLPNKSSYSRKGLTFQFKDKNSKYDKKLIKKYEKNLLKQIKKRNYI